jgi:small GTP-binding protein
MSPQYDYTWKVLVGGMGGVGKTTLIMRYLTGQFITTTSLTIGVQFHNHIMEHAGKTINLVLWDLGGEERFRVMQDSFMKGARAGLVVFDMSRYATLSECRNWVDNFRSINAPDMPILLVGAKEDVVDDETLQTVTADAENLVQELGLLGYIATSSKWGKNVEEAVHELINALMQKLEIS